MTRRQASPHPRMRTKVQFIHGLESSPQSTKATILSEHFECRTPAMDTADFEACVDVQRRCIDEFGPDVLVGSSFGGAVAVSILASGHWRGPTLLLAQAAIHYDPSARLPPGVRVWLVHGTRDELLDPEESRRLAATGSPDLVRLIEVDDDHPLRASVQGGELVRWVEALEAAAKSEPVAG